MRLFIPFLLLLPILSLAQGNDRFNSLLIDTCKSLSWDYNGQGGNAHQIVNDNQNNIYAAGHVNDYLYPGGYPFPGYRFTKTDNSGELIWDLNIEGLWYEEHYHSVGKTICPSGDGGAFVGGQMVNHEFVIDSIKYNNDGFLRRFSFISKVFSDGKIGWNILYRSDEKLWLNRRDSKNATVDGIVVVGDKIYASIIQTRLAEHIEKKIWKTQYGFRAKHSTAEALHIVRRIQDFYETHGDIFYAILRLGKSI